MGSTRSVVVSEDFNRGVVFVAEVPENPVAEPIEFYAKLDWLALAQQKVTLMDVIHRTYDEQCGKNLRKILETIEDMQNDADECGYPVVYAYNRHDWAEIIEQEQKSACQSNSPT